MHSSDEMGDDSGRAKSATGPATEKESNKLPSHAYVERMRRASVAAVHAPEAVAPVTHDEAGIADSPEPQAPAAALSPEHSVVRNRPETSRSEEPKQVVITTAPAVLVPSPHSRRLTPRAWPFAPGSRGDAKRVPNRTQIGLGVPVQPGQELLQPGAAGDSNGESGDGLAAEFSSSFDEPTTRLMPRPPADLPAARVPAPVPVAASMPISHVSVAPATTPALPTAPVAAGDGWRDSTPPMSPVSGAASERPVSPPAAAAWSPTSTRPQRAALLRSIDAAKESGRYAVRDAGVEYVERVRAPGADARGDLAGAGSDAGSGRYFAPDDEDTAASRARRFTPKQRPAQRRGRSHDRSATRTKDDRVDLARTLPDMRGTVPGRHTPRGGIHTGRSHDGNHANPNPNPSLRQTGRLLLPADNPRDSEPDRVVDDSTELPANPDFVTTAPLAVPPTARDFPSVVVEPSLRAESVTIAHAAKAPPARLPSAPPLKAPPPQTLPPARVARKYEPLPNDAAAIEQLMREHAAARGVPASRPHWNQQETLLIPREMLRAQPSKLFADGRWHYLVAISIVALLGVSALLWTRRDALRALTTSISAVREANAHGSSASTLIATEPSGAELVQDGAVVGNTPVSVPRPADGEVLYLVRMHGFDSEKVRVMPGSAQAIRVTLTPSAGSANAP